MTSSYPTPPGSPTSIDKRAPVRTRNYTHHSTPFTTTTSSLSTLSIAGADLSLLSPKHEDLLVAKLDSVQLQMKLGLSQWMCGNLTLEGKPCKNKVRSGNLAQILLRINSIVNPTETTMDFQDDLLHLAQLVHCYRHDDSCRIRQRVKGWTETILEAQGRTASPKTDEEKIRKILGKQSASCALKKGGKGICNSPIGGWKVQNCAKTIDKIVTREVYTDDERLSYLLRVLSANMYCDSHSDTEDSSNPELWSSSIRDMRQENNQEKVEEVTRIAPGSPLLDVRDPIIQDKEPASATPEIGHSAQQRLHASTNTRSPQQHPATYWAQYKDCSPFEIIERANKMLNDASRRSHISKLKVRPLNGKEQLTGRIYLYEVEGNEGFLKIGYTSRTVEQRHQEWEFLCNRKARILYSTDLDSTLEVPHAYRVEALCHAELRHRRIRIYCHSCLKQHLEWFEITKEEGIEAIRKWTTWMKEDPYR